jgi:hypothetical protein
MFLGLCPLHIPIISPFFCWFKTAKDHHILIFLTMFLLTPFVWSLFTGTLLFNICICTCIDTSISIYIYISFFHGEISYIPRFSQPPCALLRMVRHLVGRASERGPLQRTRLETTRVWWFCLKNIGIFQAFGHLQPGTHDDFSSKHFVI